jgi:hypothetical protein
MTEASFHGSYRAPYNSRPQITVECKDAALNSLLANFGLVSVDFAVGEPGNERVVLKVSKPGTYIFPEVVSAGEAISVRPSLDNPPGVEVQLKIRWDDAK